MTPACIDFKEPVLTVACGGFHTAVLTDDGRVYSFGDGKYGQCGNLARKHNMHSTPHLVDWFVSFKVFIVNLSCGQYHTAAISNQGKLFTWGSGKWGQLGHGVRLDERFPRRVETERSKFGNFTKVSCGDRHTAALNDEGRVITFGSGQHGQLGHGDGADQLKPVMINDPEGPLANQVVTSVECGATTTAAVTSTGLFYLWGFGDSLHGKGCSNIQDCPRLVKMREPVKQVACGQSHVLVLTDAGDVYAFGVASMGQLGHGSRSNVRNPRLVLRGKEIHQIAAGRYHSMAVSAYGVLYSWGCSESGQCGHNSLESELFPRIVESILPSVVGQISCGEHHSFALTSIAHSSVSADVLNWKLIEDEELKLKRAMLADVPNGLKSKHILQVEQERKGIIRQLAESLKKEREDNGQFAQLQMSLIRQPEELVEDVARSQEEALYRGDPETLAQIQAMSQAAAKLMLTSESGSSSSTGVAWDDATFQHHAATSGASQFDPPSNAHSHRAPHPGHSDEDEDDMSPAPMKRTLGASASEAVLPGGGGNINNRTLSNVASSPDLIYAGGHDSEEKTQSSSPLKSKHQLVPVKDPHRRPASQGIGLANSNSTPSLHHGPTTAHKLGPLRPSTALNVAYQQSQKHKARHDLSRTQHDPSAYDSSLVAPDSPTGGGGLGVDAQTALIEFNPNLSSSASGGAAGAGAFQPLAPRMAFAEQTVKALTWVKNMVAVNPNSANVVNYNVLRLQKQFNALKAERSARATKLESLKDALILTRPSPDEEEQNKAAAERIKQLNMRLVTLNTRLMEAEENKRNYELYIIRMKEEDLQLSKQIEHLRQLVTEYDRLLAKVERMSERVAGQRGEITDELERFKEDIDDFVKFADVTVTNYRMMLNDNFRKNQRLDNEMERKLDATFDARSSSLGKLETALIATENSAAEHKEKLVSWEEKVEYYEKRFRKLSNSTGLSRSEQIIAKHYFNSEITNDLKLDIEHKQDTLLALQEQQKSLEHKLQLMTEQHQDSRWRDIGQLEEANVNAVAHLLKSKADAELWAQKVTLVEEGLLQLARAVQVAMARKDGLTSDQIAQLVPVGSEPISPSHSSSPALALSSSASSTALIPQPERGLTATKLESVVESQFEYLLDAVEREKIERLERERAKDEAERNFATRRRAQEESESTAAMELAKTFITTKPNAKKETEAESSAV